MPKNIVICADGTWNRFDKLKNTNVVKLCYCLERQSEEQVVFYDPGVGTIAASHLRTKFSQACSKLLAAMFGFGLAQNLAEAYHFLAMHYQPGDRILLFGFSRGAYTVRALAGVLKHLGLVEWGNDNLFPYMREIFASRNTKGEPDWELYGRFKRHFSQSVRVRFLGVWDTVASVGWLHNPVVIPSTANNPIVDVVRHAAAIDEQRKNFRCNAYHHSGSPSPHQDIKEVWFPGVHADIGGGYNEAESGLSKSALAWMIREAVELHPVGGPGLRVIPTAVDRMLGDGNSPYCKPSATAVLHDPFNDTPLWRLAQLVPRRSLRPGAGEWERYWDCSVRRRPRDLPASARIHQSVVDRWKADSSYRPPNLPDLSSHPIEP